MTIKLLIKKMTIKKDEMASEIPNPLVEEMRELRILPLFTTRMSNRRIFEKCVELNAGEYEAFEVLLVALVRAGSTVEQLVSSGDFEYARLNLRYLKEKVDVEKVTRI